MRSRIQHIKASVQVELGHYYEKYELVIRIATLIIRVSLGSAASTEQNVTVISQQMSVKAIC